MSKTATKGKEATTVTGTTKELAALMGLEYPTVSRLLKLLVARGIAKAVGEQKPERGFGKASTIYEVPKGDFTLSLFQDK